MENNKFEFCIKGTCLQACLFAREYKNTSLLVFDDKNTYGSSIKHKGCIIETRPQLIRIHDNIINILQDMNIHLIIDFAVIQNHLYIKNRNVIKIPINKNEIANSTFLTNKDKYTLYKAIKSNNVLLCNNLSDNTKNILTKAICGSNFCIDKLLRYTKSFGDSHYLLYPLYGFVDICEKVSRCNAINGVSYLLDDSVKYEENTKNITITSKYGVMTSERLLHVNNVKSNTKYYTVINYTKIFYKPSFYGVFDEDEMIYCITLDTNACICPSGTFLIYLWKYKAYVTDIELMNIGIDNKNMLFKHTFCTDEDFTYDEIIKQ
ncbi:hypothetical protein BDAP_001016 [Binucleata daphniae]